MCILTRTTLYLQQLSLQLLSRLILYHQFILLYATTCGQNLAKQSHCDLEPKLQVLGILLMILSATVYYSSYIWGLSSEKGLLIEAADYRLWFQLENQRRARRSELWWWKLSNFNIVGCFMALNLGLWSLEDQSPSIIQKITKMQSTFSETFNFSMFIYFQIILLKM